MMMMLQVDMIRVFVVVQVDMIMAYEGDKEKLGNAEKFYLLLSRLPAYKIRIEGMLLKVSY